MPQYSQYLLEQAELHETQPQNRPTCSARLLATELWLNGVYVKHLLTTAAAVAAAASRVDDVSGHALLAGRTLTSLARSRISRDVRQRAEQQQLTGGECRWSLIGIESSVEAAADRRLQLQIPVGTVTNPNRV